MPVALSSLRVSADFDASAYTRGAAAKVDADNRMIAGDRALNAALAQADAALAKIPGGMASVSKALLEGYGAGQQFEAMVRRIANAVDRGMGLDRANLLLDATYRKFGLTADAAVLAQRGFVSIAGAVRELNEEYAIHNEVAARAAAQMAQVSAAQQSQAQYAARYGIGGETKSAQESADAFLAQYGGLEGIARAKAQEAGAAFGAALDARMIAGASKSARDAAAAFEQDLKRLDLIAQQRAEQAGANFQRSLTEALGGGGQAATALGATYSALAEEVERLDRIEQARAAHRAQQAQAGYTEVFAPGLDRTAKSARESAEMFAAMAAAEDKAAAKASALRAAINPLEAEMSRLGKEMAEYRTLLSQGVISSDEFEQAQLQAAKRLSDFDMNLRQAATGGRVMSGELANLGYQVNDVITGLALGQPVMMIAAQQGGQIYQIFSRSRASLSEFTGTFTSSVMSMVTPARMAFGTVIALVGTAILALNSYLDKQNAVRLALSGAGRGSGATVGGINDIANQGSAFGLSVAGARELASELAKTGKIANDNLLPIVKIGKDFATTFGVDATEAQKMLAQAFSDPVRGAEQLNDRLGFLDAGMQRQINSLVAQNRMYDAQKLLLAGVESSLARTSEVTSVWARAWTAVKNASSNFFDFIGEKIANGLGLTDELEKQRDNITRLIEAYERPGAILGAGESSNLPELKKALEEINALLEKRARATQDVAAAQASLRVQGTILGALPEINARQALADAAAVGGSTAEDPILLRALGLTQSQADRARGILAQLKNDFKTAFEEISTSSKISYDAITAFSPTAKALIAQRQAVEQYRTAGGISPEEKAKIAQDAYNVSLKQSLTMLSEAARVRALSANQAIQSTKMEAELLGKTIGQQAEIRANLQARQQLEAEAAQYRTSFDDAQYRRLQKINAELGRQTDIAARAAINDNIQFGSRTALLSPEDVQIAQQLKGIYPDVATALGSVEASALRTNNALSGLSSTVSNQLVTGLTDIFDGTQSVSAGFADMGKVIARAIQEMIVKLYIVIPLMQALQATVGSLGFGMGSFGGASSTGAGGVGGLGGLYANGQAFGQNVVPFANGGAFTNKIFSNPTLFRFASGGGFRAGVMGEAGDEAVMPLRRGPDGRLGVSASGGARGTASPQFKLIVNNYTAERPAVEQRQNDSGGIDWQVTIGNAAASEMGRPGSALRQVTDRRGFLVRRG